MKYLHLILVLIAIFLSSCAMNKSKIIVPVPDGTYHALKLEPSFKDVYIVVKDSLVVGVYKDKIAKANSLKTAVVLFGEYSEKGMHELYDVSSKIIDGNSWNGYGCQCMTVAVNTADENITYYVYMAAKKSECWYEYDD